MRFCPKHSGMETFCRTVGGANLSVQVSGGAAMAGGIVATPGPAGRPGRAAWQRVRAGQVVAPAGGPARQRRQRRHVCGMLAVA